MKKSSVGKKPFFSVLSVFLLFKFQVEVENAAGFVLL